MKKIIVNSYGSVDVLKEISETIPTPKNNQVIVKIAAIGVNDPDIVMRKNGPFPTMPIELRPTLPHMLGNDYSGTIIYAGPDVTKFKIGDHVVGLTMNGTYAEYLAINENETIAKVPKELDLIPLGGLLLNAMTAWSAVVKNGQVKSGQNILIHGGAGGVGSMAIQIAKSFGAYVTTTAKKQHNQYLNSLGADNIIDYQTEDFTKKVPDLDLVVNLTGTKTLNDSYQVVKPGGIITSVNGVPDQNKASKLGIKAIYSMADTSAQALSEIVNLYDADKLKISVEKTYPFTLNAVKQAHLDFEKGSNQGKKIIAF